MLMSDSRTSFSTISRELKISVSKIRSRFNRLKEDGIIKGAVMDINPSVLGYNISAIIMLRIVSSASSDICAHLKNVSGVLAVTVGFGRNKAHCVVSTRNTGELNHLVETISNIDGVLETETNLMVVLERNSYPERIQFVE